MSRSPMDSVPKNDGHDQERIDAAQTKRLHRALKRSTDALHASIRAGIAEAHAGKTTPAAEVFTESGLDEAP